MTQRIVTIVMCLLFLLVVVSCKETKQTEISQEKHYPGSHADEVRQIWEGPKGKASDAKALVEEKDRAVKRQLEGLDE